MDKPGYYAILPAKVRYDKSLPPNAKLLYAEITAFLSFKGVCFASNAYFSKLFEISENSVSRLINQLVCAGYIFSEMEVTPNGNRRLLKIEGGVPKNGDTPLPKNGERGVPKNGDHNKESINNISLFDNKEIGDVRILFVDSFNEIRGTKFQLTKSLSKKLENIFKIHNYQSCLIALKNAMKTDFHINNSFNDLTPEFFTRTDKVEKYINYNHPVKKEIKSEQSKGKNTIRGAENILENQDGI